MTEPKSKLRIAVLIVPPVQLLDLSPIDLFFMLSKSYLSDCQLPQAIIDRGLDEIEILYVSDLEHKTNTTVTTTTTTPSTETNSNKQGQESLAQLTSALKIHITHPIPPNFPEDSSSSSSLLLKNRLDIILVPGPDPSTIISDPVRKFLQFHARTNQTDILSVCTGIFVLGQAGILEGQHITSSLPSSLTSANAKASEQETQKQKELGRKCTGPRPLVNMRLRKEFPGAKWVERRWEIDSLHPPSFTPTSTSGDSGSNAGAQLWTSAGITNGQEMIATYIQSPHFLRSRQLYSPKSASASAPAPTQARNFKISPEIAELVCSFADVHPRTQDYETSTAKEGMKFGWVWVRSFFASFF